MGKTVAIIPARGGSKGIPGKNVMDFCGKPLIAWSILHSLHSQQVDEVYVTSDDAHILAVAEEYGATPIVRPNSLATDTASSDDALLHALDTIENLSGKPDIIVFLQCTSPLRTPADIDGAVEAFTQQGADSLFSVAELDDLCVWVRDGKSFRGLTYNPDNRGRRQDREPMYLENGSIYVFTPAVLRQYGNRLGGTMATFAMEYWKSFEIDTMDQVDLCKFYFRKHNLAATSQARLPGLAPQAVTLIVYDFDGVMTDNRVFVDQDGVETVAANRGDGLGINMIKELGIHQIILSTETNHVVATRAKKVGIPAIHGSSDKRTTLLDFAREKGIPMESVLFVGNDMNDYEAMSVAGYKAAPSDAHPDILAVVDVVTQAPGGKGVIRELADMLTKGISSISKKQS